MKTAGKCGKCALHFSQTAWFGVVTLNTLYPFILETVKGTLSTEFDSISKLMTVLN